MRLLMINMLATALVLFSASFAGAFELRLVPQQGALVPENSTVLYDVYLDSQGDKNITFFSVSLSYDAAVMTYNPGLSDAADYYPLYAPAVVGGKAIPSFPATWLVPNSDPPFDWAGNGGGGTPDGLTGQVNLDFLTNQGATGQAQGTATNEWLGTWAFDIGSGTSPLVFGFDGGGNVFSINGDGTTVIPATPILGENYVSTVPEPTTALLVGLGLVGLGVAGRNRA
jgi:hypothetical protein